MNQLMWNKIRLLQIRKEAKESLYKDYNGRIKNKKTVTFYLSILPVIIAVVMLLCGLSIGKDIANYLITGISIFAGLFFSLLFIVNDKYNSRKQSLEKDDNEETVNYLKRYKHFASQLISQISYTISISIALILLMSLPFFSHRLYSFMINLSFSYTAVIKPFFLICRYFVNGLIFYLSTQLILFVLVILSSTYVMLLDDLDFEKE